MVSLLSDADIRALQCPGDVCGPTLTLATLGFTADADGVQGPGEPGIVSVVVPSPLSV